MFSNISKLLFLIQLIAVVLLVSVFVWLPNFPIILGAILFGVVFVGLAFLQLLFNKKNERFSDQTYEEQLEDYLTINRAYDDLTNALNETAIVAFTDEKGKITKVNKRFCAISKYDEAELLGKDHRILNSGFHDSTFFKNLWVTIGTGNIWRGEVKNRAKDGSYYWVDTTVIPFLNEAGKPIKYAAIRFDITHKKVVEESLSAELSKNVLLNKQFADITNAIDDTAIVAITNNKGEIIKVNKRFCELSKYSEQELLGRDHRILNSGYHDSVFFKELWATIGSGNIWTGEVKNKAKDGSFYWVDTKIVPFLNEAGKPERYIAIRFDITKQKQIEENLSAELLRNIDLNKQFSDIKNALDSTAIVAITDNKGKILKVNKTFCELSQYSEQELLGRDHRILNSGYHDSAFFKELWATIGSGNIWTGEVKNKAKDGSFYWVDTKIVPFLNDAGKPERYIAIRFDITNRKRMEEALTGALIDLQEYTKVISHDLKTPLRSISTLVDFVKEDYSDLEEDVVRQLDIIKSKSIHMNEIINGLLEFNKVGEQEESLIFEMDNLLAKILKKIPAGIEVSKEQNFPAIKSMQQKVEEVLLQLTHNAIKFNPKKDKKVIFSYQDELKHHIISVQDNGVGIDANHHERIFDLFQVLSESNSGKGVGLSICKKMVQQWGGEIWIDSTINQGTKVSFSIPK